MTDRDPNMPDNMPTGSLYQYFWDLLRPANPYRDHILTPEEKATLNAQSVEWEKEMHDSLTANAIETLEHRHGKGPRQ